MQNKCAIGCFLNNSSKAHAQKLETFSDFAQLYFVADIYRLHGKLTAV